MSFITQFLPVRRYASALLRTVYFTLSLKSNSCQNVWMGQTDFGMEAFLDLPSALGISKNKSAFLWTLSQTLNLENFATARRSSQRVVKFIDEPSA